MGFVKISSTVITRSCILQHFYSFITTIISGWSNWLLPSDSIFPLWYRPLQVSLMLTNRRHQPKLFSCYSRWSPKWRMDNVQALLLVWYYFCIVTVQQRPENKFLKVVDKLLCENSRVCPLSTGKIRHFLCNRMTLITYVVWCWTNDCEPLRSLVADINYSDVKHI